MKFKSILLMVGILNFTNFASAQGVPTIDGTHIANSIKEWKAEAERFKETIELNQKQFEALTGVRDISAFMNEAQGILNQVNDLDSWLNKQSDILKYGKDILSPNLKAIFDEFNLTNICANLAGKSQKNCEGEIIVDVVKQQTNKNNISELNRRINKINEIARRMQRSTNPKETMDLGNAMNTQIALLQADKLKMDLQSSIDDSQQRLIEKQKQDEIKQAHNNHIPW